MSDSQNALGGVMGTRTRKAWMIISKTQPVVRAANYPIYWDKKVALKEAIRLGGKVVICYVSWSTDLS